MPYTAEQAQPAGKSFKPRKHPCLRELPPPSAAEVAPTETQLTMQEEMERARMEVEDCRVRMQGVMKASASLVSFYATWLRPKQRVRLRPHYEHVLRTQQKERGLLYELDRQNSNGLWRIIVAEGPLRGKALFTDVPPEAIMP